jgi:hypothetical protein
MIVALDERSNYCSLRSLLFNSLSSNLWFADARGDTIVMHSASTAFLVTVGSPRR